MSDDPLWKTFTIWDRPAFLPESDGCYYALDYKSGGGYSASPENSLISNFKKKPHLRSEYQWRYKVNAIRRFANELISVLPENISICSLVTSKCKEDEEYDSRLIDTINIVSQRRSDIVVEEPFTRVRSKVAQHESDERSTVDEIFEDLAWVGFRNSEHQHLFMIDDVVTTGKTYAACRRIVKQNSQSTLTYGLFWARTVWDN